MVYICPRCGYTTSQKGDIMKHYKRKKICPATYSSKKISDCIQLMMYNDDEEKVNVEVNEVNVLVNVDDILGKCFECSYCGKKFRQKQGKYQHEKKFCKEKTNNVLTQQTEKKIRNNSNNTIKDTEKYKNEDFVLWIVDENKRLVSENKRLKLEMKKMKSEINKLTICNTKLESENKILESEKKNKEVVDKLNDEIKDTLKDNIKTLKQAKTNGKSIYNYIINNYNNAPDLQYQFPQYSSTTMEKLFQLGPVDGPTQLFKMNYIENVDPENRSLWCIDPSREKCLIREDGNWIVDLKGKKIKTKTIIELKSKFEQFLKAKLDPSNENIDNEVKSDVTHFLSQLYNETTEIKIFKNLQAYIVYNKDELSEKYKDKVIDI